MRARMYKCVVSLGGSMLTRQQLVGGLHELSWKIWKTPAKRAQEEFQNGYEKGLRRSQWNRASSHFYSAYKLYTKAGDQDSGRIAWALAALSEVLAEPRKENWFRAANELGKLGAKIIDAPRQIKADILAQECYLTGLESHLESVDDPTEKLSLMEKLTQGYQSLSDSVLTIPLLLGKPKSDGETKAQKMLSRTTEFRKQIESQNLKHIQLWREGKVKLDANGTSRLPCGCTYKELLAGLQRISEDDCPFHSSISNDLILRIKNRRTSKSGLIEPEYVQAIHDVITSTDGDVDVEGICRLTGFNKDAVNRGLCWLSSKGDIFIPPGFWKAESQKEKKRRETERKKKREKIESRQKTFAHVCEVLKNWGFWYKICDDCVYAVKETRDEPIRFFISIQAEGSAWAQKYSRQNIPSAFHVSKFIRRVSGVVRWRTSHQRSVIDGLDQEVLTCFGWHAYNDEDSRRESLIAAEIELGESHVSNVLRWLANSWRNHPFDKFKEYSENASADYDWFCSTIGSNAQRFRLNQELRCLLEAKYLELIREGRLDPDVAVGVITRFYLVTY